MEQDICSICVNAYTKRKFEVCCNICKKKCCNNCIELYLMNTYHEPHCMYCKNVWDYKFIYEVMSKAFIKRLQKQQQEMLFRKEIAMLPQTQKYIEYDQYIHDLEYIVNTNVNTIYDINNKINFAEQELKLKACPNTKCTATYIFYKDRHCYKCKQKICLLCRSAKDVNHVCDSFRKTLFENYKEHIKEKLDLHTCTEQLKYKIQKWRQRYEMDDAIAENSYNYQIVCVCPTENCKGFVTNFKHKCSLCNTKICVYCHHIYHEGHICNKMDIKTVDMIKKTTKACPKCATLIQKIDGCNQMWCTHCNTAFNWNTGKIDLGNIHNPHYFEWFRKMEINANNDDNNMYNCEGIPNQRYFLTHISLVIRRFDFETFKTLSLYYRIVNHINEVIVNRQVIQNELLKNLDLRLLWVKNKITEKQWKMNLFRRNKKEKINHIKNEIFDMFVLVSTDICHKVMVCNDHNKMIPFIVEWNNLIKYTNQCFEKLQSIFRLQMPYIKIKKDTFFIESQHNYNFEN